jgi:hypothetical protein
MDEKQIQSLIKKMANKAAQKKKETRPTYDPTLEATKREAPSEEGDQRTAWFKEMKRREF